MVIADREGAERGTYIGFLVDYEILECGVCTEDTAYRLRYTQDETLNLQEHRFKVQSIIESEHPNHSARIQVA
jgi:hypothetical protein